MAREIVTASELAEIMTSELHKRMDDDRCSLGVPTPLLEPDNDGCNWSPPTLRCSGVPADVCAADADRVVHWARKYFNIEGSE